MNKVLKIFLWILAIFAVLATIAFFWGKSVWDKISFGIPKLTGLNLNGITLTDLANIAFAGSSKEVTADIAMSVENKNNFSIPFSSLKVKLFYNDSQIAETSDLLLMNQKVLANSSLTVNDRVKIILNASGIQMLIDKLKNGKAVLKYSIMVKVFGISLPKSLQSYTLEI